MVRENIQRRIFPYIICQSNKKTKYKTLDGESVEPVKPGTVRDCREFYKKYDGVDGFKIFGNNRYIFQYLSDKYPQDEVKFDISQINLVTMDIEVKAEQDFLILSLVLKRC